MPFFLFEGLLECGLEAKLEGKEARHAIKSRRLRPGEIFEIQDSQTERFQARILERNLNSLDFVVEKRLTIPRESSLKLELWLALPKQKSLKWVLQKGTELGVSNITVFRSRYSSGVARSLDLERGLSRWRRICMEACKQSGRTNTPQLRVHQSLAEALSENPPEGSGWLLFTETSDSNQAGFPVDIDSTAHRLLVGPEGGWHDEEMQMAEDSGMKPIRLGPRVMRTETAVLAALAILQYLHGDMGILGGEHNFLDVTE